MAKGKQAAEFNHAVAFQNVNFGDKTVRVGVVIDRELIDIETADEYFCDRRLIGLIVLGHAEDDATQRQLYDDMEHKIAGAFDVKGFSVNAKQFKFGLTFALAEIDRGELTRFAKAAGRLIVQSTTDIPEREAEPEQRPDDGQSEDEQNE